MAPFARQIDYVDEAGTAKPSFPIIEREEKATYGGRFRSSELCLAYMNALAVGNPVAEIRL
jgi:hypothetical protein